MVGRDIRLITERKEDQACNEGSAKIESRSMEEEVRAPQILANEHGIPPAKWVVLNKLVLASRECVVGTRIAEYGQGSPEQVTDDEGEVEGYSRVRSQKI